MSATGAEGVRWAKVSAFRAVRSWEKDCSLGEQAANSASLKAAVGASGAFVEAAAVPACAAELLSCAGAVKAKSNRPGTRASPSQRARCTTSILRRGEDGRQVLCERRARHHFIATRGARLRGQFRLYMRQEADHPHSIFRGTQPLDRGDRLASRVQLHDQQFWCGIKQGQ